MYPLLLPNPLVPAQQCLDHVIAQETGPAGHQNILTGYLRQLLLKIPANKVEIRFYDILCIHVLSDLFGWNLFLTAGYDQRTNESSNNHYQTFQGAVPLTQSFSSIFLSRRVSMGCQKP